MKYLYFIAGILTTLALIVIPRQVNITEAADSQPCLYNVPGCTSYIVNEAKYQNNNNIGTTATTPAPQPSAPAATGYFGTNSGSQPCLYNVPGCTSYVPNESQNFNNTSAASTQSPAPAPTPVRQPYIDSNGYTCTPPR